VVVHGNSNFVYKFAHLYNNLFVVNEVFHMLDDIHNEFVHWDSILLMFWDYKFQNTNKQTIFMVLKLLINQLLNRFFSYLLI